MLSPEQEESIARILSNLTPIEYSMLMSKVKRDKWIATAVNYSYKTRGKKS